jgi:hypothetical protein
MWESRRDFQRVWKGWEAGFLAFHAFHTLSFPWPDFRHGDAGFRLRDCLSRSSVYRIFPQLLSENLLRHTAFALSLSNARYRFYVVGRVLRRPVPLRPRYDFGRLKASHSSPANVARASTMSYFYYLHATAITTFNLRSQADLREPNAPQSEWRLSSSSRSRMRDLALEPPAHTINA